jgi:hypothetical protein
MPYGTGPLIRTALMQAKPWQRYLICVAMVAGGVVLMVVGHPEGIILALAGALIGARMIGYRRRARPSSKEA